MDVRAKKGLDATQQQNVAALVTAVNADLYGKPFVGVRAAAAERQLSRIVKKLKPIEGSINERSNDAAALAKFLAVNARSLAWRLTAPATEQQCSVDTEFRHILWRATFGYSLGCNFNDAYDLGPGANVGSASNDKYTKLFDCCLTTTSSGLYTRYAHSAMRNPLHLAAEKHRRRQHGPYKLVPGCVLAFVPKNDATSRTICTEPTLNMLAQKSIATFLVRQLKQIYKIDISQQSAINRRLALEASLHLQYATVDQESASDSVALGFCEWAFPSSFVRALKDARSPFVTLPDGSVVELGMVSGMGNGFTFALQTLIFSAITLACQRVLGINCAVNTFGDDMIVPEDALPLILNTLDRYGFVVNREKTFSGETPFRESCGCDAIAGYDITPVYCRQLLNKEDFISLFNRLRDWSRRHFIPMFRTLLYLRRQITGYGFYQPSYGDPTEGLWCNKRQALLRGARPTDKYGPPDASGVVVYTVRRKFERQIAIEDVEANIDGLLYACSSGNAEPVTDPTVIKSGPDACNLLLRPKVKRFTWRRVSCYTSVW